MTQTTYTVRMWCEGGGDDSRAIQADSLDSACEQAEEMTRDWVRGGDWGEEGARVSAWWSLEDDDGDEVCGDVTVDVEPDHAALIRAACGGKHTPEWERCCGTDPDDHNWTSEGEGGCSENPGVWATGGTSMRFVSHCRACGLRRRESTTGSQRNPGDHDRVEYTMPDRWCAECQREECDCDE